MLGLSHRRPDRLAGKVGCQSVGRDARQPRQIGWHRGPDVSQGRIEATRNPISVAEGTSQGRLDNVGCAVDHPCKVIDGTGAIFVDLPRMLRFGSRP